MLKSTDERDNHGNPECRATSSAPLTLMTTDSLRYEETRGDETRRLGVMLQ